jgi:hypothetical protein
MDSITLVVVPWLLGGLTIASLLIKLHRRSRGELLPDGSGDPPPRTDVINVARIRVAGLGGLGLVAMAAAVSWAVPGIGVPVMVGLVLGTLLALALILRRRIAGPMPSSGRRAGANTILSIDRPLEAEDGRPDQSPPPQLRRVGPAQHAL